MMVQLAVFLYRNVLNCILLRRTVSLLSEAHLRADRASKGRLACGRVYHGVEAFSNSGFHFGFFYIQFECDRVSSFVPSFILVVHVGGWVDEVVFQFQISR